MTLLNVKQNSSPTFGTVTATSFVGDVTGDVTGNVTGNVTGDITGDITGNVAGDLTGGVKLTTQELTDSGAITIKSGVVILNKAGVIAATLADPTATTDDGKVLRIYSITAQAHTVDNSAGSGYNGGGAGADVGTFGGAIADHFTLLAWQGVWYVLDNVNVTLA